jgi:hypothetical protein
MNPYPVYPEDDGYDRAIDDLKDRNPLLTGYKEDRLTHLRTAMVR